MYRLAVCEDEEQARAALCALCGEILDGWGVEPSVAAVSSASVLRREGIAMREIRRHAFAYMKGVRGGADFRRRAGLVSSLEELRTLADELINSTENS